MAKTPTHASSGPEEDSSSGNATLLLTKDLLGHTETQCGCSTLQESTGERGPSLCNVEQEQGRGRVYSSHSTFSYKTEDSGWGGEQVLSTDNVEEEQGKGTQSSSVSTSPYKTEDSHWESVDWSVPAMLLVDEPHSPSSDHLKTDTDSECSDVDLDNDWVTSGNSDSDTSVESLESKKQSKWLHPFFKVLNDVAETEYGRDSTLFYCPACRGSGLGETDLYKGLKPLITHAKKYTKRRVKLHKQFAAILEEDLKKVGNVQMVDATGGKPFHRQWHLIENEKLTDPLIVWPPVVLIRTTGIKLPMHQKRVGMQTKQLLKFFKDSCPKRVRHAYDPADQSGLLSLLIFLDSPVGYMHAKQLAKKFKQAGKGRKQWTEHAALKMQPCCDEWMYAYMATEEDMMFFDTCDASKKKFLWSMKSFKEFVVQPLVEMREAKLENNLLKAQLKEQEERRIFLETSLSKLYRNLKLTEEESLAAQEIALGQR